VPAQVIGDQPDQRRMLIQPLRHLLQFAADPGERGNFFKILDRALGLRMMARSSRKLAIPQRAQHAAQRLLGDDDPEFLENQLHRSTIRHRTTP
jgi:hypothetical protein